MQGTLEKETSATDKHRPLFPLRDIWPKILTLVKKLLVETGEFALAESVDSLQVYDRCRCGVKDCGTVYTQPRPAGKFGQIKDSGHLKEKLEMRPFKVKVLDSATAHEQLRDVLTHRIFVTDASKDFVEAAAIEESSMIDTKNAPNDAALLADQISKAFGEVVLTSKKPFLLYWKDRREPTLKLIY
jgi:hypothetical protein